MAYMFLSGGITAIYSGIAPIELECCFPPRQALMYGREGVVSFDSADYCVDNTGQRVFVDEFRGGYLL